MFPTLLRRGAAATFALACAGAVSHAALAQDAAGDKPASGMWVAPHLFRNDVPKPEPVPEFSGDKPVYALASAIGGQLSRVVANPSVGTHTDPYERVTLRITDHSLDAMVLRGLDRVVARHAPDSERVFMRLNPLVLDDVPPVEREKVAFERLTAEISRWPQRHQWTRIVIVTPHYRAFERNGLGSRLHGVGLFVQNLENLVEYDVVEPDGTPGAQKRNRYVALYYYATVYVLDAKTLEVIESQPWLIDEKIHDSKSDAIHVGNQLDANRLAERIEVFAERASNTALARTLRGTVEVRPIRPVGEPAAPTPPAQPAPPATR